MPELRERRKLEAALVDLTVEAVRIQYCSKYIRENFRKTADVPVAVKIWNNCVRKVERRKLLPLLYVASDVMQTADLRNDFRRIFERPLTDAFVNTWHRVPTVRQALNKLLNVWGQRKILPRSSIFQMRVRTENSAQSHPTLSNASSREKRKRPESPKGTRSPVRSPRSPGSHSRKSPRQKESKKTADESVSGSVHKWYESVQAEVKRSLDPMKTSLHFLVDLQHQLSRGRKKLAQFRDNRRKLFDLAGIGAKIFEMNDGTGSRHKDNSETSVENKTASENSTSSPRARSADQSLSDAQASGRTLESTTIKIESTTSDDAAGAIKKAKIKRESPRSSHKMKQETTIKSESHPSPPLNAKSLLDESKIKTETLDFAKMTPSELKDASRDITRVRNKIIELVDKYKNLSKLQLLCLQHVDKAAEAQRGLQNREQTRIDELTPLHDFLAEFRAEHPGQKTIKFIKRTIRKKEEKVEEVVETHEDSQIAGSEDDDDEGNLVWNKLTRTYVPKNTGHVDDWRD